ncbi:hypothetical protein EGW08_015289 [Elysia chlorotica]|uniref:Uncharacterized protein n=1 Tax=Elysia chlorotica TaxID=188477 RepID=A0A433T5S3_ELYCH|nr:hypothetical protein EGW08_015289 [Elysia chlorotica]
MMAPGQFSQAPASLAPGQFHGQFAATPASSHAGHAGFAQFPPLQNGTGAGSNVNAFGMPAASSAFGGAPGGFPGQQSMMPGQQMAAGGWGQMGFPAQPMANPFMNAAASMQNQVPPPSGSSNPFL